MLDVRKQTFVYYKFKFFYGVSLFLNNIILKTGKHLFKHTRNIASMF